jgi:hypothetical protein
MDAFATYKLLDRMVLTNSTREVSTGARQRKASEFLKTKTVFNYALGKSRNFRTFSRLGYTL